MKTDITAFYFIICVIFHATVQSTNYFCLILSLFSLSLGCNNYEFSFISSLTFFSYIIYHIAVHMHSFFIFKSHLSFICTQFLISALDTFFFPLKSFLSFSYDPFSSLLFTLLHIIPFLLLDGDIHFSQPFYWQKHEQCLSATSQIIWRESLVQTHHTLFTRNGCHRLHHTAIRH